MSKDNYSPVESTPYAWPYTGRWNASDTALILVDSFSEIPTEDPLLEKAQVLPGKMEPLIRTFQTIGIKIIYSVHPWYVPGKNVGKHLSSMDTKLTDGISIMKAVGTSAFYKTDLHERLSDNEIQNVIFAGLPTETSVHSTMRDANDRGFECLLLEDGCMGTTSEEHEAIIRITRFGNGLFGTTASIQSVLTAIGGRK